MSFHDDYESWEALARVENCPVCRQAAMPAGMEDVFEFASGWLDAEPQVPIKGTAFFVARCHAVELFDLGDEELAALMKDVAGCTRALKAVTGAVKINIEIHGNTIPHLHVHLIPRYRGDPFAGQPVDFRQRKNWYAPGEFEAFTAALRTFLLQARET